MKDFLNKLVQYIAFTLSFPFAMMAYFCEYAYGFSVELWRIGRRMEKHDD